MIAHRIAFAVLIMVFLLVISAYVIVITQNITVSSSNWLFNWNPPPAKNAIPLGLTYPEALIPSFPNGTMFMANMLLTFNGELEENTLIQVENASCQIPPLGNANVIAIGFQDAFLPNMTSNIQKGYTWGNGAVCVVFTQTPQNPSETWSNLTVSWENNITFPVAGDYSPSIFATFGNNPSPVQYTFDQIKIHVLSASEVNAEKTNRLNLSLTIAIVGFSFIEGFMVIHELLKKEETKTQPEQTPTKGSKMSGNQRTRQNKDADLLKIQILADYYQASYSFQGSIVSGFTIGLIVVAITLRLQNIINDLSYYLLLAVVGVFFFIYGTRAYRIYHSDLERIDNLFTKVQNGETLPSITEMRKEKPPKKASLFSRFRKASSQAERGI